MSLPIKNSKDMNVKPGMGKTVDLGGVFLLFGGPWGYGWREMAFWDVDEAQGGGRWINWQILGRYNLTLPRAYYKRFLAIFSKFSPSNHFKSGG